MIPTFDSTFEFDAPTEEIRRLSQELLSRNPMRDESVRLASDTELGSATSGFTLYYVREGCLQIRLGDKVVMIIEEGEVVALPPAPLTLSGPDFSVLVDAIPIASMRSTTSDVWVELSNLYEFYAKLWLSIGSDAIRTSASILPSTRVYPAGETIIKQGDVASEVYTLIEGEADVFVDGIKVGEVQTSEFFGILASVTHAPRTATVIARSNCAVLCVDTAKFQELIRARPVLVEKLIAELSRMVVDLNDRVVALSKGSAEDLMATKNSRFS